MNREPLDTQDETTTDIDDYRPPTDKEWRQRRLCSDDGCIGVEVAESAREMCPWATVEIVDGAGHFLQLERPELVNARVVEFLTA